MKKTTIIGCILLLVVIFVVGYNMWFAPVKVALKQSDIDEIESPYYLVQWTQVTGSSWEIIGDQDGYYEQPVYIIASGETPSVGKDFTIGACGNTYICYGSYVGEGEPEGLGEVFPIYNFTGWDIMYPVKRDGFSLLPKGYLCRGDF